MSSGQQLFSLAARNSVRYPRQAVHRADSKEPRGRVEILLRTTFDFRRDLRARDNRSRREGHNHSEKDRQHHFSADFLSIFFLVGQHRTTYDLRLKTPAAACFHHISQNYSGIHKVFPGLFVSSDEESDGASGHLQLCGVALIFALRVGLFQAYHS
jgi:hypothetical protein